jgi:hypothetical protein
MTGIEIFPPSMFLTLSGLNKAHGRKMGGQKKWMRVGIARVAEPGNDSHRRLGRISVFV